MARYTKEETAAINAAWREVKELCSRTNWTDAGEWREAEKLERRQAASDEPNKAIWARAMICKAWLEGLESPETPASKLYWIRRGYRDALLLGVRHAVERRGDDYNGPIVESAANLCRAVIAACEAHSRRIVEG